MGIPKVRGSKQQRTVLCKKHSRCYEGALGLMVLAIKGVYPNNKGSELMLRAILAQRDAYLRAHTFAADTWAFRYTDRELLRVQGLAGFRRRTLQPLNAAFFGRIPRWLLRLGDVVSDTEIDAYIDASGFAYSDQYGPVPTETAATLAEQAQKRGQKTIFLPQAFGPFDDTRIRRAAQRLVHAADLIFPRDPFSHRALADLGEKTDHIHLAPDFTLLLDPTPWEPDLAPEHSVCIVPNHRMLQMTTESVRQGYLSFLKGVVAYLRKEHVPHFVLIHDTSGLDRSVIPLICSDPHKLLVVESQDTLKLKFLLGQVMLVVGSRFHALIAALSQGTPAIGTSWSHKYSALYEEFGCPECLVDLNDVTEALQRFEKVLADAASYRSSLSQRARSIQEKVHTMWRMVSMQLEQR